MDAWLRLFQSAIAGWEPVRSPTRPILEQVVDHRLQTQSNLDFAIQFREFIEVLLSSLEKPDLVPTPDTLLIVPIDDLDLQVDRAHELLDAIRLLHHPRLVWLCVGDWDLLLHAVADDVEGASLRHLGVQTRSREHTDRARTLAHALCTKAFPTRYSLRKLALREALSAMDRRPESILTALTGRATSTKSVGKRLALIAEADPAPLLSWRELRHCIDGIPGRPTREHALLLLRTLLDPEGVRTRIRTSGTGHLRAWVEYREDVEVRANSPREKVLNLLGGGHVFVSTQVRFTGSAQARLALSLEAETDAVRTRGVSMEYGPILAWSTFPGALAWWPWVERTYSPLDLLGLAGRWARWVAIVDAAGGGVDALVYGWASIQEGHDPPAAVAGGDLLVERPPWDALVAKVAKSKDPSVVRWGRDVLPLFAAPEYGMSDRAADALSRACGNRGFEETGARMDVLAGIWHTNRRRIYLPEAIWQARIQKQRRGVEEVEPQLPTDAEVEQLDNRLERTRPGAPWYYLRDPDAWWLRSPVLEGFLPWMRDSVRRRALFETERGSATVAARMLGRGLRVIGPVQTQHILTAPKRRIADLVTAYRRLAGALVARAGFDPDGPEWRALARQVEIAPGDRGVVVQPPVRLQGTSEPISVQRPYRSLSRWAVSGLEWSSELEAEALAAWLGLLQVEASMAGVPMRGFEWEPPVLLVLNGEDLRLPPFARWADVQAFASAWEERLAEFELMPLAEESRSEWLVVAYLDLALTLLGGVWLDQWRGRTAAELPFEPIRSHWMAVHHTEPSEEFVVWAREIQSGETYRSLPEKYRKAFLASDTRVTKAP